MKLVAALLLLYACNGTTKADTTPPNDTIKIKKDKTFTIELSTSMGTGYQWQPTDSSHTKYLRIDSVTVINNTTKEDGADTQVFHCKALQKGKTTLAFIRKRPWESFEKKDKQKQFTIIIE